jgi:hypothetical protein
VPFALLGNDGWHLGEAALSSRAKAPPLAKGALRKRHN